MPHHSHCSIGHKDSSVLYCYSLQLYLQPTAHVSFFRLFSLVAIFLNGLAMSGVVFAWQLCNRFFSTFVQATSMTVVLVLVIISDVKCV